jgi:hypothetical protein
MGKAPVAMISPRKRKRRKKIKQKEREKKQKWENDFALCFREVDIFIFILRRSLNAKHCR